ncbi:TraB/GumN family protein [Methanococcoides burtonii]|uniref:TraB family protein n=1 Tax=Methanococcoides burtonii (strain DSM 6242 / NBRC 107633 / OCM 468 / ACE-M) TaxID=259564 RepID=Q12VA4_METBU|nr:TraB/GumN family protein [Methanococcoides burtonii]ABE52622.1 TraB family protein [Methanococcoides burtonii DSM 6242]
MESSKDKEVQLKESRLMTDSRTATSGYNYDTGSGSVYSGNGGGTFSQTPSLVSTERADPARPKPSEIIIVGTAHVSEKSVNEVTSAIENEKPDIVAVELCQGRYDSLKGEVKDSDLPIKDILSGGKIYYFLVHLLLAYVQKKIGDEMGVQPGAEMITAIDVAEANGAKVALVDRDIQLTLQRFWSKMSIFEKFNMLVALVSSALGIGGSKNIDIDNITDQDMVTTLINELRKASPNAATVLIDERDAYIAGNLLRLANGGNKKIIAVLGAGHKQGVEKYLKDPKSLPPISSLTELPQKRFSFMKIIGIGIVGIALATFGLIIMSGTSLELLLLAFGWWFIINGVLSAAGAALAKGHPYSVITAFFVAWLTSLNPLMAAGWFAGLMEAKQRNPTTADLKEMVKLESFKELQKNNFFRVVFVAALANVGSTIGTFLGAWVMLEVTGINKQDLLNAGLTAIGFN